MPWKILLVCLLAANLALSACAPLIIVGTAAAAGGLTASKLNTDASEGGEAAPGDTGEAVMAPAVPVEPVDSETPE